MGEESRDNWGKFDIVSKAIGVLLLPLVIFFFTIQQKKADDDRLAADKSAETARLAQQQQSDLDQRTLDRSTELLKNLASENKNERLLAITLIDYLITNKKFPQELGPALINTFLNDKDPDVRLAAENVIEGQKLELQSAIYSEAQNILTELKYYTGGISGYPDEKTTKAVQQFQKDQGMQYPDGYVGPLTLAKLREARLLKGKSSPGNQ